MEALITISPNYQEKIIINNLKIDNSYIWKYSKVNSFEYSFFIRLFSSIILKIILWKVEENLIQLTIIPIISV